VILADNPNARRFEPTPHPTIRVPIEALRGMSPEEGMRVLLQREEYIAKERHDRLRYGHRPEIWKKASELLETHRELLVLGGNRSGKTEWAAREVISRMMVKKNATVWCFASTAANSVEMLQPRIFTYLPPEWKAARKSVLTNITYSVKGGFTESKFTIEGRQCIFRHYSQDTSTVEGGEVDVIWADELIPLDLLRTLRYRLVDRNGVLLVTFTPVEGWSPTVRDYLSGAKTLEDRDAELLPRHKEIDGKKVVSGYQKVPVVQMNGHGRPIIYFHTSDNPFAGWGRLQKELRNETKENILCRAYGVPTRAINNRFPRFNEKVHVIRQEDLPTGGTRYMWIDPASARNWFIIWTLHDTYGRIIVYREFPAPNRMVEGVGYPGVWAEPDGTRPDGRPGPAQKDFGFGLERYIEEIKQLEQGETIFERWMDSRAGNTPTLGKTAPTTLIEEMADLGMDFSATPGDTVDEGVSLINSLLDYDPQKPVSALNQPKLFVTEECKNVIYSLREWTGAEGKKGACRDPIDLLRYVCLSGAACVEGDILLARGGGAY